MRKSITKVTAETQDSVTTTLNDGDRVIIWGDSSQHGISYKLWSQFIAFGMSNDEIIVGGVHPFGK